MFTTNNTSLSLHFTLSEALKSPTAEHDHIINQPSNSIISVMVMAAAKLEVVRNLLNRPMNISSWYRCPELNAAVGSKPTSQHIKGEAIDFECPEFGTPLEVCKFIVANKDKIQFDQLILEHTWVHISFPITSGEAPRLEVLSLLATGGYSHGLTDKEGKEYV